MFDRLGIVANINQLYSKVRPFFRTIDIREAILLLLQSKMEVASQNWTDWTDWTDSTVEKIEINRKI